MNHATKAVFLSYASQDAEAAKRICESLRQAGVEVWFDQSELVGGDAWDQKIRKQIKECALFVPIISANTQARTEGYFRVEWRLAAQRTHAIAEGIPFLVPVVIDATAEPAALVPGEFRNVQWTRLRPEGFAGQARLVPGDSLGAFCERVKKLLGGEEVARAFQPVGGDDTGWKARATPSRAAQPPLDFAAAKSIAVLAFANLSHDPENEYFSDGISEELLNVLAKVPGLRVTARTSSFYFKGKNLPVPRIAQELGVSYIVEGSVRKAGTRVRITAQLIDAVEDAHLWSETFDRELKDIFAVQDEIAGLIAQNLQLTLGARRPAQQVDPEAYRLCLEGRRGLQFMSADSTRQAELLFRRALEIAPDFPPARAGLMHAASAGANLRLGATAWSEAAQRARETLRVEPTNGDAHALLAMAVFSQGRIEEAALAYQRAVEFGATTEVLVATVYGIFWLRLGRPDREVEEMARIAKLDPFSWLPADLHGHGLLHAGRLEDAVAELARAEKLGAAPVTYSHHAIALGRLGRNEEATTKAREALDPARQRGWGDAFIGISDGLAGWALAAAGATAEAAAVAQALLAGPEPFRWNAGIPLLILGRRDEAFAVLPDTPQPNVGFLIGFFHDHPPLLGDSDCARLLKQLGAAEHFETFKRVRRGEKLA